MSQLDFEGVSVSPNKTGVWLCPFNCGDPRYPRSKWKTEKGFRSHMLVCSKRPSAVRAQEAVKQRDKDRREAESIATLEACPIKVGDTIHYMYEYEVSPEYEQRGSRMVRVRYEAVKRFEARTTQVTSRECFSQGQIWFNGGAIPYSRLCATYERAQQWAGELTEGNEAHRHESALLR